MSITTFAELKTYVAALSDRSDLTNYLTDFVTLATSWLNHGSENVPAVRARDMETVTSLTPTSGVCTLPTDYLQYRRVVEEASIRRELTYITPSQADVDYADRGSGLSSEFTIVGNSLYMFPLSSNDIELTYYAKIADLSDSNTTNWLLTKHPNIYVHAVMLQIGLFINDDGLIQRSVQILSALVNGLNKEDQMANYAYAPIRARGVIA